MVRTSDLWLVENKQDFYQIVFLLIAREFGPKALPPIFLLFLKKIFLLFQIESVFDINQVEYSINFV